MREHYLFGPAHRLGLCCPSLCLPRWASSFGACFHLSSLFCPSLKDKLKPFSICFSTEQQAGVSKNSPSVKRSKVGRAEFSKLRLTLEPWWHAYPIRREPCFSSELLLFNVLYVLATVLSATGMWSQIRGHNLAMDQWAKHYYHCCIHKQAEASERLRD